MKSSTEHDYGMLTCCAVVIQCSHSPRTSSVLLTTSRARTTPQRSSSVPSVDEHLWRSVDRKMGIIQRSRGVSWQCGSAESNRRNMVTSR